MACLPCQKNRRQPPTRAATLPLALMLPAPRPPSTHPLTRPPLLQPFVEQRHGASGTEAPTGADVDALAARICSDYQAAGKQIYTMIQAGAEGLAGSRLPLLGGVCRWCSAPQGAPGRRAPARSQPPAALRQAQPRIPSSVGTF